LSPLTLWTISEISDIFRQAWWSKRFFKI